MFFFLNLHFYVFFLLVNILPELLYSSPKFIEHPYNQCFELCILNSPFCLVLFLELFSVLSFGTCLFVSTFWQPPCVCFPALGKAVMSPGLSRVNLRSRCPVGPNGSVSPGHLSWVLQVCPLYGLCMPSCCSCFLVAICMSVGRTDSQASLLWELAGEGLNLQSRVHFSRALVPVQSALWVCCSQMQPRLVL